VMKLYEFCYSPCVKPGNEISGYWICIYVVVVENLSWYSPV
jgi:hypothetical protein